MQMKGAVHTKSRIVLFACLAVVLAAACFLLYWFNILPQRTYTAEDFGIQTLYSAVDYNQNGTDDFADLVLGARKDAQNHPKYDGSFYVQGGYPPDEIGVCTDVIWRAFRQAGYSLRDMVDADIQKYPERYPAAAQPDPNIDFRRVRNLRVFFDTYATLMTVEPDDIAAWQPGDIVIFGDNDHIGIVSDKRSAEGRTYIIHNGGQPNREEDYLKRGSITAHYRFDASKLDSQMLKAWKET